MGLGTRVSRRVRASAHRAGACGTDAYGISSTEIPSSPALVRGITTAVWEALDLLDIGVLLCGASGELLLANRTADEFLRTRDGLDVDSDGVLFATHESSSALGATVRRVAETAQSGPGGNFDTVFSLPRQSGKQPLTMFVRALNCNGEEHGTQEATTVVVIGDAAVLGVAPEQELQQPAL